MNVHKLKFDTAGNVENITFVLAYKNGNKIGNLTNINDIVTKHSLNSYSEFSFTAHKKIDNNILRYWDDLTDFKLIWIPEWDMWFEIKVELNENDETVKNVSGITIGEAELSQIMLYDIEINTEADISRDDYTIPTTFYNPDNKSASLIDRLTEKAPHYKFIHIDSSLINIQRTYTFDSKSIYDAFKEIEKEMNCLFIFHAGSNEDGTVQRSISVYDLEANCFDCGYRNTFVDKCPICGSENVKNGFGDYTNVFISKENLATEVNYSTDTNSVKNCFKLVAGDDLMTAAIRSCNPNGSDYIYYFSKELRQDMSIDLRNKIEEYDILYNNYQQNHEFNLDNSFINDYNDLIKKYSSYDDSLNKIENPLIGYPKLMKVYFDTIDMVMFLKNELMPNIEKPENSAKGQGKYLMDNLPNYASTTSITNLSLSTANNIVISLANSIIKGSFKITIGNSSLSNNIWNGNFIIKSYSDENDIYTSPNITISINENYEEYIKQRLDKLLNSEDKNYYDIVGLFKQNLTIFTSELKKYCLDSLNTFQKCCQSCIDIMVQQGIASSDRKSIFDNSDIYQNLYLPYYDKLNAIQDEIMIRESEIETIEGKYNNQNELIQDGLQIELERIIDEVQNILNFEKFIGEELHNEFCSFIRMDKYSNNNYISNGLNNTELFKNAIEFLNVAQKEIFKSATLQHSISGTLRNFLRMKEFHPIVNSFKNGNWISIEVDKNIYRLRIIEYTIDFSDTQTVDVVFSDVLSVADGLSDLENILSNAENMATSYNGIIKQSEINTNFRKDMSEMIIKGLDMTNTKIVSNADNQDITWDEHGLLCREYNDILSDYNPCQLKIINHGVYLTTDNWKTAKAGIGRFFYFDPKDKKYKEGYGVIADTLVGNLILSSEVGIYNEEKSIEMDKNGIVVTTNTYNKNVFTIQKELKDLDGNISYQRQLYIDDNGNIVLGGGASISWDNITGTDHIVTDVDAEKLKNDITIIFNQKINILEQQTDKKAETWYQADDPKAQWTTKEEKDKHNGDLWFNTTTSKSYIYNSASDNWEELKTTPPKEVFDAIDGKAQIFVEQPKVPYHVGDLWFDSSTSEIMTCVTERLSGIFTKSDWEKKNKYTDDSELNHFVESVYNKEIEGLQAQIDGQIETHYYDYQPTLTNEPALSWETEQDKEKHIGDLFFWKSKGFAYRFLKDNTNYVWQLVKDTDVTTALENAQKAQDTADGKRRVFVSQPIPPYDVGDLWTQGKDGKLMRCKVAKVSGVFASTDWEIAVGYTDDTALKDFLNGQYVQDKDLLKQQIDGKVQTFRQPNDPSVDWNTPELKKSHIGDLWYKTDTNETFMYNGNSWDAVTGEVPQELWDKVDGKAQIFTTTTPPTPPYHKGDLWFAGANADIKTCIITRESGSYVESDWKKYNKYTDDTKVDDVISGLGFTTSITGTKVISPHIVGGDLKIGNPNSGTYYASIDTLGKLTATGADIKGKIIATEGMIGNFNISNAIWNGMNSFNSGNNGVYLGTDGIALGGGKFKVTSGGKLTASGVDISGNINAESGTIGGFNITSVKNDNDHAYGQTLYRQVKNVYENGSYYDYQAGIKGKNTSSSSTDATEAAFYIRKKLSSDTWANSTIPFYVRNNGYVYAENMNIGNTLYSTGVQRSESGLESKRYKVMESWVEKVAFGMLDKAYDNYATFDKTGTYLWSKGKAVKVVYDEYERYIELSPELDTTVAYLGNAFETWEKLYVQNIGDTGTPVNSGYFTNLYTKVNGVWTKVTGTSGGGTTAPTYTAGDGINISSNRISVTLAGEDSGGLKFNNYGNIAISTSFLNSRYSQINHTHSSSSITWSGLKSSNGDNNGHVHRGINNSSGYGLWINGSTMIYPASNADGGLNTTTVTDLNSGIDLGGRTVPFKGGYFKKLYLRNTDIESLFYLSVSGNTLYLKNNIDNSTISNVTLPSGGGGSSNYNDLNNKPSINNITLSGNKTLDNLGIGSKLSLYGTTLYLEKSNGSTISSVNLSSLSGGGGSSGLTTIQGYHYLSSITEAFWVNCGGKDSLRLGNNGKPFLASPAAYDYKISNASPLYINANGTIGLSSSSKRYKHDIRKINFSDLSGLYELPIYLYKYNDDYFSDPNDTGRGKDFIGFIAEDVESINPKLVEYKDGKVEMWSHIQMTPALLALIQNNHKEIQKLKNTILQLQGELSILKQKIGGI